MFSLPSEPSSFKKKWGEGITSPFFSDLHLFTNLLKLYCPAHTNNALTQATNGSLHAKSKGFGCFLNYHFTWPLCRTCCYLFSLSSALKPWHISLFSETMPLNVAFITAVLDLLIPVYGFNCHLLVIPNLFSSLQLSRTPDPSIYLPTGHHGRNFLLSLICNVSKTIFLPATHFSYYISL